jgi:hypothetical protein
MTFKDKIYSKVVDFFKKALRPFDLAYICLTHRDILFKEEYLKIRVLCFLWEKHKLLVIFLAVCNFCSGPFSFLLLFLLFPLEYGYRLFFLFNLLVILFDIYLIKYAVPMPLSRELFLLFISTESSYNRYISLIKPNDKK